MSDSLAQQLKRLLSRAVTAQTTAALWQFDAIIHPEIE
jgi:hypothetical protein